MAQIRRAINSAIRSNNQAAIDAFTKIYALLFCAWAEANFSKVLHTPHGFSFDEIAQVQAAKANGIGQAWKSCVQLGLRHLDAKRGSFLPNTQQRLERAVDKHVFDPSVFRNKLAHGQWIHALNRDNDALQPELTAKLADLHVVAVGGWILTHEKLANLVETLIESPKKVFMRDWHKFIVELDEAIEQAESYTYAEHVKRLLDKDNRTGAKVKHNRRSRPFRPQDDHSNP